MFSLLPLLGKRLDDLSLADLDKIAKTLKVNIVITEELKSAGMALLKGQGIDNVSELIQKPESIQQLLGMFAPPAPENVKMAKVVRCPHCEMFSIV